MLINTKYLTTISCLYSAHIIICRLLSRVVIIPFSSPGIQARTLDQQTAFSAVKSLKAEASSSIGYFIALGKQYRDGVSWQNALVDGAVRHTVVVLSVSLSQNYLVAF